MFPLRPEYLLLLIFQGVQIPGLGTFSFLRQKLDVGNNKFILIQRPVFLLSEKLAQIHGLKLAKIHTPGKKFDYGICLSLKHICPVL